MSQTPGARTGGIGLVALAVAVLASALVWVSGPSPHARRESVADSYAKGLAFLAAGQHEDGEFPTYSWLTTDPGKTEYVSTVFTAAQVLYSLAWGDLGETSHRVRERAVAYLLGQREPPGVWRYYGKAGAHLLSPDVDDTSIAWSALILQGHAVTPDAMAQLEASRNETGLFNTWIGDPATWVGIDSRDIDVVVNLNALLLFALAGRADEAACRLAIELARVVPLPGSAVYYPSPRAFAYALSRAYADGGAMCLGDALPRVRAATLKAQQSDGSWGDDLETALGAVTLLNAGYRGGAVAQAIDAIVARQMADGGWAIAPAYRGAVLPINYGSRSLTTALCLEALGKYLKH